MKIDVLSLFPNYFKGPFDESIIKRAIESGILNINNIDIRNFCVGKHRQADDRPYGGGPGMVMMVEPVVKAIRSCKSTLSQTIYLSPQGKPLTPQLAKALATQEHLILLCGHYEGIDQRVIESEVDLEISIGDYVLTNGCLAACVLIDVMARFIPGVLGDQQSQEQDSFENGQLDHPHYTRPQVFEGKSVPEILISGDHKKINEWRERAAAAQTLYKRPDLIKN